MYHTHQDWLNSLTPEQRHQRDMQRAAIQRDIERTRHAAVRAFMQEQREAQGNSEGFAFSKNIGDLA